MPSKSLIEIAYTKIRQKIIFGDFMPGTLLSENELANELNMSRTPIRTAISHLESEGFVVSLKNRGILVKEISFKEILDMMEVISTFEIHALNSIIERGCPIDIPELDRCLKNQVEASRQDNYSEYVRYSQLFTRCIISAINNQVMLQIIDSYQDKIIMIATVNWKRTPHQPHYSANRVNESLYQALTSSNYEGAMQIVKEALLNNRNRMVTEGRM
ncbi:GntR family transcriptional regulator [Neobacillus drentensis]|uniref:GntR family transcriptional regulator n=1 Tax=Neobacillus drentensis TaxID=220684 RepID=UPI003000DD3C